ncbi:MAG: glycosyl hydrolase-related protein, partial [bacterium]
HNWVDYTDSDQSAGFSLLNNSKYGFDVRDNVLRMTLLRSPVTPDPEADIGRHSIEYAVYTHPSDWRDSNTPRRGYEFNYTPHVIRPGKHGGKLPATHSFFSASPANVIITAVKMAEDGDGVIIRLVETDGREGIATVRLPWEPKNVVETNLIEDELKDKLPVRQDGNTLSAPIGRFEIKTFKLIL